MDGVRNLEVDVSDLCAGYVDFEVFVLCACRGGSVEEDCAVQHFALVKCSGEEGEDLSMFLVIMIGRCLPRSAVTPPSLPVLMLCE